MVNKIDMKEENHQAARMLNARALQFLGVILWKLCADADLTIEITVQEMQDFNLAFCHVPGGTAVSITALEDKIVLKLTTTDGDPLPLKEQS